MVYTVSLKHLSFKMDLSNIDIMLEDQAQTYAILKYAKDVPMSVYSNVMQELALNFDELHYRKLIRLVKDYKAASSVGIQMTDEVVGSIIVEDGMARYEEDGEVIWCKNVEPAILIGRDSNRTISFDDDDDDF